VSAGLGGGSSDAAATLVGLNRLWGLGLSRQELMPLAAEIGSDVPFFLHGGTAMVQGRGERVRTLPTADIPWFVVLSPDIRVSDKTAHVFSRLTDSNFTAGQLTRKLEARIRGGGDVPPQFLFNAFDDVAPEVFPDLRRYWDTFGKVGAREVHVAGAGPSLYAPLSRRELGTAIELLLRHTHGWTAHLTAAWRPAAEDEG
jgi:4-diphosphocytidyl-2-C-methyl-D-erythritol kinase